MSFPHQLLMSYLSTLNLTRREGVIIKWLAWIYSSNKSQTCSNFLLLFFILIFYCLHFLKIFNIYIKRAAEIFGVTHTREIYEKAIEVLDNDQAR